MIGGASLSAEAVLHPGPTVGYRIEGDGAKFSLGDLPDHEPALAHRIVDGRPRDWISPGGIADDVHGALTRREYFEDEYEERIGWGHSSVAHAVAFTRAAGAARRLVLFHHGSPAMTTARWSASKLVDVQTLAGRNGAEGTLPARAWSSSCNPTSAWDAGAKQISASHDHPIEGQAFNEKKKKEW